MPRVRTKLMAVIPDHVWYTGLYSVSGLHELITLPPGTVIHDVALDKNIATLTTIIKLIVEYDFEWCVQRVQGSLFYGDQKGADYDFSRED